MLKRAHIPTASRKGRTEQPAKIHSKDHCHVALVLYDSSPVSACFSVATGICGPCKLSCLDAHLLHYPPGPYKAGCFFEMKMWTWFYKRQVVSVTGITLSLWKSTQTFLKIGLYVFLKIRTWKSSHFWQLISLMGCSNVLVSSRLEDTEYCIFVVCESGQEPWALNSDFWVKLCTCFRYLVFIKDKKISQRLECPFAPSHTPEKETEVTTDHRLEREGWGIDLERKGVNGWQRLWGHFFPRPAGSRGRGLERWLPKNWPLAKFQWNWLLRPSWDSAPGQSKAT